jgi:tetratricopeptide (TPR) repeat protein
VIGQVKWHEYLKAKRAADAGERGTEIARLREEAVNNLQTSLARQRGSWQAASEPMPATMFDTQLLLGEVCLEGQQWSEAAPLFEALVDVMKRAKPTTLDRSGQRALVGGVRAWLATGKVGQAAEATLMLLDLSSDEEQANGVLLELLKLIEQEARKAAPAKTVEQTTFAAAKLADPLRDLQGRVLDALVPRIALTVPQLTYLGDACMETERREKAREVYERLLAMIDKDAAAKATAGAAATGIRSRLVGLLRSEGKLEEASQQVEALIKEHPNALGPLMEKGYILQSLAERDPRRYDECVDYWTKLRLRLGQSKTRGAEYYEVLYNAATCLVRQARQSNQKVKAQQAEQMLKVTLLQAPKLNGPEMVAKYEALLGQAAALKK